MLSILRKRLGDNKGTRDFVRILQLHQEHPDAEVETAVSEALRWSSYSYDAVKHLLLSNNRKPIQISFLDSDTIPGVTDRSIPVSDPSRYDALLSGGAV